MFANDEELYVMKGACGERKPTLVSGRDMVSWMVNYVKNGIIT